MPLLHKVQQASRAGYQNIDPPSHGTDLRSLPHSPIDKGMVNIHVFAVGPQALTYLICKLPGRSQHQSPCSSRLDILWVIIEDIQNWERKRSRLSRACRRRNDEAPAVK